MTGPYDDIIHLPHHVSTTRPQMPMEDRAAQFSPFAALTGYHGAIKETARQTDQRIEIDDYTKELVNAALISIADHLGEDYPVHITYFLPDSKKSGGAYVTAYGRAKKLDAYNRLLIMTSGDKIPIDDIIQIQTQ